MGTKAITQKIIWETWRAKLVLAGLSTTAFVVVLALTFHSTAAIFFAVCAVFGFIRYAWTLLNQIEAMAADLGSAPRSHQSPIEALKLAIYHSSSASERDQNRHRITGLPTRELLVDRMKSDRKGNLGIVAFADFDRLCSFDPAYADWAIEQFAQRMAKLVGPDRMIAHVDRSAFVLWFDGQESPDDARRQLDAIGYALGNTLKGNGRELTPSIRLHLAAFSAEEEDPRRSLEKLLATCALLSAAPAAKKSSLQSAPEVQREYELEQQLRFAIQHDELELQFQPQINAGASIVSGAEALLRWKHPGLGIVSPQIVVPLLERSGLIEEVGLWILNSACREMRTWREKGWPISVAVNVSNHQLNNPDLHSRLLRILGSHGLPAGALEVELTETAAAEDPERSSAFFRSVRASGISAAIDDFGTGFSSLSVLRNLKFDKIKIDREFVTLVDERPDSQAICQSIIALARGLGIRVIAEGIERHEEYVWLRKHGCSEFQGYYFAPPLNTAAFHNFVERNDDLRDRLALNPLRMRETLIERLNS